MSEIDRLQRMESQADLPLGDSAAIRWAIDKIANLTSERDEAREAARWLLGRTETFADENEARAKWPWLEVVP